METAIADFVRTSSAFLIRHAISRLPPLIVVDAIANADGLVPLSVAAKDLRIRIPALPQPGPPVSRPISIRVYAQLPPPGEYQVFSYTVLPAYPVGDIEVVVPRRFVGNEGEYWLTYTVDDGDNVLRATTSTLLRVHKTPPFGYLSITPPRPLLPANLATPLITDEYLANNDPVWFRIPEHEQINDKKNVRAVFYYGNTNIHLAVPYTPPVTLSDVPAERMIPVPAAIIRARGNGTQQLTYRLIDQGGNRARDSLSLEVTVAIRVTPSNIAMPRIPLAIAPDNTVTQWDINQSGQPGGGRMAGQRQPANRRHGGRDPGGHRRNRVLDLRRATLAATVHCLDGANTGHAAGRRQHGYLGSGWVSSYQPRGCLQRPRPNPDLQPVSPDDVGAAGGAKPER
ncbi:hypothetical protein [Pseudomonas sp. H2_H03]